MKKATYSFKTWDEIRAKVKKSTPQLASIFDEINPDSKFKFIVVNYPFGSKVIEAGVVNVPDKNGNLVPITHPDIDKTLKNELSYCSVPFGFIQEKCVEVYRELPNRIFSVGLTSVGSGIEMGIWEYFGDFGGYIVNSGARSLYMVPSISDAGFHNRINHHFDLSMIAPVNVIEHGNIFREVANSEYFEEDWTCQMIFLGKAFSEHLDKKSIGFLQLKEHIVRKGWNHSSIGRSRYTIDLDWHMMMQSLEETHQRINPYVIDTMRHFISLLCSQLCGNKPAIDDSVAPIKNLQRAWIEHYRLKDYVPTIMQPASYNFNKGDAIYYSLRNPSLLIFAPSSRNISTNIDDMRDLIKLVEQIKLKSFLGIKVNGVAFKQILEKTEFSFFHEPRYVYGKKIKPTTDMAKEDPNLTFMQEPNGDRVFAHNGPFCRGCIRISQKNNN
jgi:hypothetical protein